MIVAEDVLLLLTDDATGKAVVDGTRRDIAVAGAVIAELAAAGRLEVAVSSGLFPRTTLRVVDPSPLGDDVLDDALVRAAGPGSASPTAVLGRIRKGLRERLYARLVARGVLRAQEGRVLGVFPTASWPAVDATHEAEVLRSLHEVLVAGRAPTPREASLVALLAAVDAVPKVRFGTGLPNRELKARAKQVAAGDVGGQAARKAVEAVEAAVMAGITAAGAAAASSG
ncbi:GOLPH3/VPS74 family protein [Cellulomonas shaoxiangyii]|uniref:GPP34 family phosphoprotein n=1 Tax=Cellulomonas shaoxiangyii TaxID=2566013 RepID=A0A4V1CN09_9CELL|nr:GPP34 family phosphoprotein [Cellulomonas shaoxiangyii]QCB94805.1 GPP34 family phosphoprotein [Cellulomonas shaoxiangyii]TGY86535.1 GPP34 family phosphoprotein [Cellulomonas shaoxiangyii]